MLLFGPGGTTVHAESHPSCISASPPSAGLPVPPAVAVVTRQRKEPSPFGAPLPSSACAKWLNCLKQPPLDPSTSSSAWSTARDGRFAAVASLRGQGEGQGGGREVEGK